MSEEEQIRNYIMEDRELEIEFLNLQINDEGLSQEELDKKWNILKERNDKLRKEIVKACKKAMDVLRELYQSIDVFCHININLIDKKDIERKMGVILKQLYKVDPKNAEFEGMDHVEERFEEREQCFSCGIYYPKSYFNDENGEYTGKCKNCRSK